MQLPIKSKVQDIVMTAVLSLHGDLRLVSAVNLFQLIKLATLSGHLVVNCAENSAHFIFTEGKLNYGFAREGRKRIGQILLDSQLITNHQLNSCLDDQKTADKWQKLGSILVKNGYLKHSQIIDLFQRELKTAFLKTITWSEGKFIFIDTSPLVEGDIVLEENIEALILQSLILLDDVEEDLSPSDCSEMMLK